MTMNMTTTPLVREESDVDLDESALFWLSGKQQKHIKLSLVSTIVPGQRTICKDRGEAEIWFTGLKALLWRCHLQKGREGARDYISSGLNRWHKIPLVCIYQLVVHLKLMKAVNVDAFRISSSSAVSTSSQGSGHDDTDALRVVYIWGEGTSDGMLGGGMHRFGGSSGIKKDSFVPKAMESAVLLDVRAVACGRRHATLVTKQGEVFTWGGEQGGRLGHGVDSDVLHPKLVHGLESINVELLACGEYHSYAITLSGELYIWGGGTSNSGLFGCTAEAGQWLPKKLNGPLEGMHVSFMSCGTWHTAIVPSAGQLFTFGEGTFGVLGHGDRKSVSKPREVESLKGLRTVRAACGVWHTAAVVEVMVGSSTSTNCSGKLFTRGDGDKGRLGHGDKEARLVPTCVAALVEPNFCQVVCGHSLTAAFTTTGHVYTMGSPVYGQLGNPHADGRVPTCVQGKLMNNFVEELACGAYHIAVLTSKSEGANGRLGHGDSDDRNSPALVETLKDKQWKIFQGFDGTESQLSLPKIIKGTGNDSSSHSTLGRRGSMNQSATEATESVENLSTKSCIQLERSSSIELAKDVQRGSSRRNKKLDSSAQVSPSSNGGSGRNAFGNSKSVGSSKKFLSVFLPGSRIVSRASSPTSRRSSPPCVTTLAPELATYSFQRIVSDDDRRSTNAVKEEVVKLRAQVEELKPEVQLKEVELERTTKQLKEALAAAGEENAKCRAAK
ncbi:hypothetical protein Tsubulata_008467, partial [Turnera subulata]